MAVLNPQQKHCCDTSGGPVAIGITANKSSVCNGEGITFMVTSEANVGSSPVYEWFVNGQPRSSDVFLNAKTLIINNWNYPNNYAVTCRVTSSIACTPNNPATSDAIPISIIPSQTFTVGISILPSKYPLTYCEDEISFQANPSHPVTSYAWTKTVVQRFFLQAKPTILFIFSPVIMLPLRLIHLLMPA